MVRIFDIPTMWEVTRQTTKEYHHEQCSYRTDNMLCDCAVMEGARWVFECIGSDDKARQALAAIYNDGDVDSIRVYRKGGVDNDGFDGLLVDMLDSYGVKDVVRGVS